MATHDPIVDADYPAHVETYKAFLRGARISIITIAVLLALLAYFLT
jgi:hypothetical protein